MKRRVRRCEGGRWTTSGRQRVFARRLASARGVWRRKAVSISLCMYGNIQEFLVRMLKSWGTDIHSCGIFASKCWPTCFCYMWRVLRNVERFGFFGFQGSMANHQALFIIQCHALNLDPICYAMLCVYMHKFMKLRLDRVLSESYEGDSLEESLESNPYNLEFEKTEN